MRETKEAKLIRMTESIRPLIEQGKIVAGIDEVGRGPLAGPIVAGCVYMTDFVPGVDDSKKLSEKRREELYEEIKRRAIYARTGWMDNRAIDEMNVLNADRRAMEMAAEGLPGAVFFVDAVDGLALDGEIISLVHGDALNYMIAAASILAKVERDRYMIEMDALYPEYGFKSNKGYGTPQHIRALRERGPCPLHRATFIGNFV